MLILYTLQHLTVDGICGAALAAYAVEEFDYAQIVFYFGMYNLIAFGLQAAAGFFLDKHQNFLRTAFIISLLSLGIGTLPTIGILAQAIFLGIGNCIFHVTAGSIVLQNYSNFKALGLFVSSGAIGLALGLNLLVDAEIFLILYAVLTFFVLKKFQQPENFAVSIEEKISVLPMIICAILLLSCVIMRGFGGGGRSTEYLMLFPIVFATGKFLGGVCCDKFGWQNTILLIFLLGFLSLQFVGLVPLIILTLAFNMTMPLTLRLLHYCNPKYPGLMFGMAAGCLLPGAFFHEEITIAVQAMVVIQFLVLFTTWKIYKKCSSTTIY